MLFQTVAAVNYLPAAFVLARTIKDRVPDARLCVLVTDGSPVVIERLQRQFGEVADFIGCDALESPAVDEIRRYYTVFEFSSACKVLALDYQLRHAGRPEVCFVDPDMMVLGNFTPLIGAGSDIVLTYHALSPYPSDGELPTDTELVVSGVVNGGLVYVRHAPGAMDALGWLVAQTQYNWFLAPDHGLYCDQQWLSLLPVFFPETTQVLRSLAINIAYWNLHERPLSRSADQICVGKDRAPALLFHFSGFPDKGDQRLSRHSRRRFDADTEICLAMVIADYRQALDREQARLTAANIRGDLSFSTRPLHRRMKLAERRTGHRFTPMAPPSGRFARIGGFLDRALG